MIEEEVLYWFPPEQQPEPALHVLILYYSVVYAGSYHPETDMFSVYPQLFASIKRSHVTKWAYFPKGVTND